jgi:16S rRNA (adenine1518-N6/adenine1519-N6)-dimethyltransferase
MTDAPGPGPTARALLERHGLRAKKSWGQNFLQDMRVVDRIVAGARTGLDDVVIEIGAGLGALTCRLAAVAGRVIAVERDPDLIPILRQELARYPNAEVVAADAMEFDLAAAARKAGRPVIVLGNLPYQITSPLLFRIVESAAAGAVVKRAVLMVQKEVAERIVAAPGSKIFGRLSVMVQAVADAKILFHVGPGAFLPQPSVTSTVFALTPRSSPRVAPAEAGLFAALVRGAFAGRRKMLRRSLEPLFGAALLTGALEHAQIAGTRRAEELHVEDFARLARSLIAGGAVVTAAQAAQAFSDGPVEGDGSDEGGSDA